MSRLYLVVNIIYQVLIGSVCPLSLYVSSRIKKKEEGTAVKPEGKTESPAPAVKTEAEIPTSVRKTDGENSVPASKAVSLLCFLFVRYITI